MILQNQEEFPGFIRVCYCHGMEFCVVLGKGLFNYDGLLLSEDDTFEDVSSGEGPSEEEIYFWKDLKETTQSKFSKIFGYPNISNFLHKMLKFFYAHVKWIKSLNFHKSSIRLIHSKKVNNEHVILCQKQSESPN